MQNDNEKRDELPLLQGLRALLHQLYPGLNQAVVGVENTATGAVTGLDGILKRDLTGGELQLFAGLNSLLHKVYPGLNNAGVSAEQLVSDLVAGLDKTLKKRGEETAAPVNEKRDMNPLLVGLNWDILRPLFHNLNGVVVNTEQAVSGAVSGVRLHFLLISHARPTLTLVLLPLSQLDDILKKRATGDIPPNTVNADVQLEQLLRNLLGGRGLLYNLLRGLGLNQ